MDEILKCECPPGSENYENEAGMLICGSFVEVEFRHKPRHLSIF